MGGFEIQEGFLRSSCIRSCLASRSSPGSFTSWSNMWGVFLVGNAEQSKFIRSRSSGVIVDVISLAQIVNVCEPRLAGWIPQRESVLLFLPTARFQNKK